MADAKLTALTAASALAAADLFYVSQSAASRKATGTQLLALVGTTYVPLAGNATMTGALTLPAGTVSAPSLTFTGAGATTGFYSAGSNNVSLAVNGSQVFSANDGIIWAEGVTGLGIVNALFIGGAGDLRLQRDAAATLAQRNGTTQQIFRLYNSYTDSSNFERLTLTGVAGTSVNITAETLGTGADNLDLLLTSAGTGSVYTNNKFQSTVSILAGSAVGSGIALARFGNTIQCDSGTVHTWTSGNVNGTVDSGISRNAAGIVEVNNGTAGTWRDLKLRNLLNTEYHQMTEMTAPSAPATNSVRIYAEDNGAGKTRLMALFATGSAVQIAIEP